MMVFNEHALTANTPPIRVFQNSEGFSVFRQNFVMKGDEKQKTVAAKEWTTKPDGSAVESFWYLTG